MRRRNILFVSPCWPLGRSFGGQLRALHIARALKEVGDITLQVVGSEADNAESARLSAAEFKSKSPAIARLAANRRALQRIRWAVDVRYLNVHGFVTAPEDRERVISYFPEYDLIWVLNSRTPNLLQIWRWPHTHLDVDDIPSSYLRALARTGASLIARWKAHAQRLLLYRRERRLGARFTTLSVCSDIDRAYLGNDHVHVIPNGFERPNAAPIRTTATEPPRIGFIGLYSYAPNLDGVQWFLKKIWPAIRTAIPGIRFRLIGKDSDGAIKPVDADVDALGWMPNPAMEIATWSAMVVPIRVGGGTRIKIADAFSRKCPVVSTRFGAQGYALEDGKQLRLADSPQEFASACIHLVREPTSGEAMARRAWTEFLERWTWDAIAPKVWAAAEDCLRRSSTTDRR